MEKLYALLQQVSNSSVYLTPTDRLKKTRAQLEIYITELIEQDISRLVDLLYRVDIPEKKLKTLLNLNPEANSAALITDLILERQLQKQAWRQQHPPSTNIPEDERW